MKFETIAPSRTILKLSFVPKAVYAGTRELEALENLPAGDRPGWSFDTATRLLTICHPAGPVDVRQSPG